MTHSESQPDSPAQSLAASFCRYFSFAHSPKCSANSLYLAEHEPELLEQIIEQSKQGTLEHSFWREEFFRIDIPGELASPNPDKGTRYVQMFRNIIMLLPEAKECIQRWDGNPSWTIFATFYFVTGICFDGGLENTKENVQAALYAATKTDLNLSNENGSHNELLRYMSEHVQQVRELLPVLDARNLTVATIEALIEGTSHRSLVSGAL